MEGVDPAQDGITRRVSGLRNLIEKFKDDGNFAIAIGGLHNRRSGFLPDSSYVEGSNNVTFSSNCIFYKPKVEADYKQLVKAIDQLEDISTVPSGNTKYENVFNVSRSCIESDIGNSDSTQYKFVFVTDGAPTEDIPRDVINYSREIVDVGKVERFQKQSRVNLYFYFMDNFEGAPLAGRMIQQSIIAAQEAGGNSSRMVIDDSDGPVDYDKLGIFSSRGYLLKHFSVTNMNAALEMDSGKLLTDSDADGIDDETEITLGYDPLKRSSMGTCSDLVWRLNGGSCPGDCPDEGTVYLDSDHDGLSNCDDMVLGTDQFNFDIDRDLIFDGLELRIKSDAKDGINSDDIDRDGNDVLIESGYQTGVTIDDRLVDHKGLTEVSIREVSTDSKDRCYEISVENIPLFKTKEVETETLFSLRHLEGANVIKLMFYQVSEDNPTAPAVLQYSYQQIYFEDFENGIGEFKEFFDRDFQIYKRADYE